MGLDKPRVGARHFLTLVSILFLLVYVGCSQSPPNEDTATVFDLSPDESIGIQFFDGSFEDALIQAANQQKKIFVDVYTMWCGPCIVMQETVFQEASVGEYFNERFVNFKLDAESEAQNGPELAARFDIGVYPTYLILDSEGVEINRGSGSMSAEHFVAMVSQLLGETDSKFDELDQQYIEGNRSLEFIQAYLMEAMVELGLRESPEDSLEGVRRYFDEFDKYKKVAEEYFGRRPYEDLINALDAQLIMYYLERVPRGNELVEYVLDNYDRFLTVTSVAAMSQFALNATLGAVAEAAQAGDDKYLYYISQLSEDPLISAVDYERKRYPSSRLLPENMKNSWEIHYLVGKGDWESVHEVYKTRLDATGSRPSASQYSDAARTLARSESEVHRSVAVEYGRKAYEMEGSDPMVAVSYLSALYSMLRKDEMNEVIKNYRAGLSDSEADRAKLKMFDRIASGWQVYLDDEAENSTSDD